MKKVGPTEIRTRVVGFRVPCASHYTIGPFDINADKNMIFKGLSKFVMRLCRGWLKM